MRAMARLRARTHGGTRRVPHAGDRAAIWPRDIVVFVEEEKGRGGRLAFAAALAETWQAHLIATFVAQRLALDRHAGFAVGDALTAMLKQHRSDVEAAEVATRKEFDALARRHGLSSEWRISANETGEALMLHARHAGLAIVGPSARRAETTTTLGLSGSLIFASGRPTLLLPLDWPARRRVRTVVVGWNASREATRAIADAMPFLVQAEDVRVVVVPDTRMRELYGADPGADIARHLARYEVPVMLEQHPGEDAGTVLLERCRDLEADLLVVGAVGRSRISEFVLGGVTRTLLDEAGLPVLLSQ